jgi:membrane fusion protein, multidrug efflux system
MIKKIIPVVIVIAVIALIAWPKIKPAEKSAGPSGSAGMGPAKLSVEVQVLAPRELENKAIVTGSVIANESAELRSEASGKVTSIYFKEGEFVKKGKLLLNINDDELKAQLEKARYNQKLNEDSEYRNRLLLEKEAISQEEYDNALNRLNTALADIKLFEAQIERTKLYAPFDGYIGLRMISEGAYITPNNVVASIFSLSPAKIEFSIPARYSTKVTPGKAIRFSVENDSKLLEGKVYAIEPQIDPNTRTLKIRALANNPGGTLLPGQFVRVELIFEKMNNAILVPTESIIQEMEGARVYVSENKRAKLVSVETGIRTTSDVEIVSGLNHGDTLVTTGLLQIREGIELNYLKVRN